MSSEWDKTSIRDDGSRVETKFYDSRRPQGGFGMYKVVYDVDAKTGKVNVLHDQRGDLRRSYGSEYELERDLQEVKRSL